MNHSVCKIHIKHGLCIVSLYLSPSLLPSCAIYTYVSQVFSVFWRLSVLFQTVSVTSCLNPSVCLWVCPTLSWGVWWRSGWLCSGDRWVLSEGNGWSGGCCDSGGNLDCNLCPLIATVVLRQEPGSYPNSLGSLPGHPLFDSTAVDKKRPQIFKLINT